MHSKLFGIFVAFVLLVIISNVSGASLNQPFEFEIDPIENPGDFGEFQPDVEQPETQHGLRQKRAACDLLTFLPVPGDSMCAAKCIAMRRGFRGGYYTKRKVCRCRL